MSTLRPPESQTSFNNHAMSEKGAERLIGLLAGLDRLDQLLALPTHPAMSPAGLPFARFQLRSRVGAGRFGVVFLADDPVLGRPVVVKVPQPTVLADQGLRERFLRESRATAQLEHPGIVSVFEAGEVEGLPYLAAAYIQGPTLRQWRIDHPDPVPADVAARFIAAIARAVHHAHERGVLHCDLSPSNVLLRPVDPARAGSDQLTDYAPIVADFGLARVLDQDPSLTRTFQVAGTPQYMSPEQARGDRRNLTSQTDIYTVGVLLYELLVGRPPFGEDTRVSLMDQVLTTPVPAPRTHIGRVPQDLEAICLKCLEKNPQDRFVSMRSLADDLDRFLNGLPVTARPVHGLVRLARWSARNRAATVILLAALVTVGAALGFAVDRWTRENLAQADLRVKSALEAAAVDRAEAAKNKADTAEFYATLEKVRSRRLIRSPGWSQANRADLLGLSERVRQLDPTALRTEATAVVSAVDLGSPRELVVGFHAQHAAFDPTGRSLALGMFSRDLFGSGHVQLVDSQTGAVLRTLTFPADRDWERRAEGRLDGCWSVLFHPGGKWLVVGTRSGSVAVWDVSQPTAQPAVQWKHSPKNDATPRHARDDRVSQLAFDVAGLLWSGDDETAAAWNPLAEWSEVRRSAGYLSRPPSGDRSCAVVVGEHGTAIHPSGQMHARRERDQELLLCRSDGHPVGRLAQPDNDLADDNAITDFAFSPDGTLLAAAAEHSGHLKLWDVVGSRLLAARTLAQGSLHFAFRPDGRELAVVLADRVLIFPVSRPDCVDVVALQPSPLDDADLTADGRYLATSATAPRESSRVVTSVFDLTRSTFDQLQFEFAHPSPRGNSRKRVAVASDGQSFVTQTGSGLIRYQRNKPPIDLVGPARMRDVQFTPNDRLWVAGTDLVAVWTGDGERKAESGGSLACLFADDDGAVVGGNDGSVRWYSATGQRERTLHPRTVPITALARAGNRLIAGTATGEVLLLEGDRIVHSIPAAHTDTVWTVAIGARGLFATGSADRLVRIGSAQGEPLLTLPQTRPVRHLGWSADGTTLFVLAEGERGVRRWRLDQLKSALTPFGGDSALP